MTKGKKAIAGVIAFLATVGIVSNLTGGTSAPAIPSTDNTNISESTAKPVETNVLPAQEAKTEREPTPAPAPAAEPTAPATNLSNDNYYTNSAGNTVHSPAHSTDGGVPAGASARCADGTYSFSQSRRGTCSHHGGVAEWL